MTSCAFGTQAPSAAGPPGLRTIWKGSPVIETTSDANDRLRLVMMGTGPFAVPTFRALPETPHEVVALVTRPARRIHSRRKPPPSPMRDAAQEQGLPIFDPEDVNSADSQQVLRGYEADLFIVADYGQILSASTLSLARLGGVNLHGSLLPKYRGAAPINWAIYHGQTETGVTLIHMTPKLDAGPCIAQRSTPIGEYETAPEVEDRLAAIGAELMVQTLGPLAQGETAAIVQDPALATRARRLKKSDANIDWSRTPLQIHNHIRAMQPWPKCDTHWLREDHEPLRLIIGCVAAADVDDAGEPGRVLSTTGGRLLVASGGGAVEVLEVQPVGKRMLTAEEFLRGYSMEAGDRLGAVE